MNVNEAIQMIIESNFEDVNKKVPGFLDNEIKKCVKDMQKFIADVYPPKSEPDCVHEFDKGGKTGICIHCDRRFYIG